MKNKSPHRPLDAWISFALGALAIAAVIATWKDYGFGIDEATYVWVARQERLWFTELPERGLVESFSPEGIERRWHFLEPPYSKPEHPHSNMNFPLAHHLLNSAWLLAHPWIGELSAYRLASATLFGVAVGAVFLSIARTHGAVAGATSAMALFCSPRVFGHAHFACTETPLCAIWTFSLLALLRQSRATSERESRRWGVASALLLGGAMAVKLTAWPALFVSAAWLVFIRPIAWRWTLLIYSFIPLAVVVLLTPNLWRHPISGIWGTIALAAENPWKITSFYLGKGYEANSPMESGIVLFLVTTPLATLFLAAIGLLSALKDKAALLFGANLLLVVAMRTFGFMPMHDVERQFLPAYYFAAILSGVGMVRLAKFVSVLIGSGRNVQSARQRERVALVLAMLLLLEPMLETWRYRAHALTYYNSAVGGLAGAMKLGFEPTYWFEAATDDVWRAMLDRLPEGSRVFFRPDHPGLEFQIERGLWRSDLQSVGPANADFMVLYGKQAAYVLPDPKTGELKLTDLALRQRFDPALVEVRFDGVRLLALVPVTRAGMAR